MGLRLFGAEPFSEPMLSCIQLPMSKIEGNLIQNAACFLTERHVWEGMSSGTYQPFCSCLGAYLTEWHQATTINTIKKKHQVKIQTITNGNKRTFRIEGNKQNVQNARQDISRIISETYNRDKRHEQTRPRSGYSAVCRYFRRGYCNKGRNCPFIHNAEYPVDISPRTPHREQTNRPNWPSTSQNPSYRDEEWPVPSNQPERKRKRSGESEEDLVHKLLAVMKEHKK